MRDPQTTGRRCGLAPRSLGVLELLEREAAKQEGGGKMIEMLENIAIVVLLLLLGASVFVAAVIGFLYYLEAHDV